MNANHSFSRRFFADFIASRVKAWRVERVDAESSNGCSAHPAAGPIAGKGPRSDAESRPDGTARDGRAHLFPDLADPRRPHGLEIG